MAQVTYNVMTPQNNLKFRGGGPQGVRQQMPQNTYGNNMTSATNKGNQVGFFDNMRAQSNPRAAAGPGAYEMAEASNLGQQAN